MTVPLEPAPDEARPNVPVTTEWTAGVVVLRVTGEIDYATAPQVTGAVSAALAERPPVAVIDLHGVGFFGSAGLSMLVEATRAVQPGSVLRITAGTAALRAMQLTGLDDDLEVYPTVAEALTAPTV
jgi:anti-sigma B factor antagonist